MVGISDLRAFANPRQSETVPSPAIPRAAGIGLSLVVEDDLTVRGVCCAVARQAGIRGHNALSIQAAWHALQEHSINIEPLDVRLSQDVHFSLH